MLTLIDALLIGYLMDRVKVWKILLFCHTLLVGFIIVFVISIPEQDHIYTSVDASPASMALGFTGINVMATTLMTLNEAISSKAISRSKLSRGSLMGCVATFSSIGVLTISGVGGNIYPNNHQNPYFLMLGFESLTLIVTLSLAVCRMLNI